MNKILFPILWPRNLRNVCKIQQFFTCLPGISLPGISHLSQQCKSKYRLWSQGEQGFFSKLSTRLAFRLRLKNTSSFGSWILCSNSFCLHSRIYGQSLCRFGEMFLEVKLKVITVWNNHIVAERQTIKVKQLSLSKIECTNHLLQDKQIIQLCYHYRKWSNVRYTVS